MLRRIQLWAVTLFAAAMPVGLAPREAALVVAISVYAWRAVLGQRRPAIPATPLNGLVLAWFALAALSMQNAGDLWAGAKGLQKLLKWTAISLVVWDTAQSRESRWRVLLGWFIGLTVVVVDGFWQAIAGRDLLYGRPPALAFDVVKRIDATFHHPADLSIYLISICPLAVALAVRGEARWRKPLWVLVLATVAVVLLARTRGGFISLLCALAALSWWLRHWLPAALAVGLAGAQAVTVPLAVKAWSAAQPTLLHWLAEPGRLAYWQAALNMIRDHPVIGVGVNTFVKAYPRYRIPGDDFPEIGPYAHNMYLHQAAELGLAGLAVLLAVVAVVCVHGLRTISRNATTSELRVVSAGLLSGFVGYALFGTLESSIFYSRASAIFWFFAGLLLAASTQTAEIRVPQDVCNRSEERSLHQDGSVG